MILNIQSQGKAITNIKIKDSVKSKIKEEKIKDSNESLRERTDRTLINARKEGVYTATKNGLVANYIAPLAIHLGFSSFVIILLTALPQLIGAFSQLFVERLAHFFKNRHKLMIICGYFEAYVWILVTLIAAFSINYPFLLILLVVLDAVFVNIQNPIWNAILGDVIPSNRIATYFGKRNVFVGLAGLFSTVLAGLVLSKIASINVALGFSILFFLGFLSARLAVNSQERIFDPSPKSMYSKDYSFYQFLKNVKKNNFGNFATFFSLYKLAVAVSTPFFAIYMLRELNFSYLIFTIIIGGAVLSSMISNRFWTNFTLSQGSRKVLFISSFIIPFIPLFWLISVDWKVLLLIELVSGVAWAGFNIASSTFVFEAVNPKQKIKFLAYNNVLAGIGAFIGTMIGMFITFFDLKFLGSVFFMIFLVSSILRLLVALFFVNKIQEEKVVSIGLKEHYKRFITIRPKEGVVFEIIGDVNKNIVKKTIVKPVVKEKIKNVPGKGPFKIKPKY
ncbi:MFS transporter [Candidatus Woesearchaeota archaeon]|nr:MFS transporter [Candidatus Woesearchaeota archaeon]